MEKLRNINQLNSCKNFVIVNGENVTIYEFLCVHPHNEKYILALETLSMEGKKLYIPNLLGETTSHGEVYVGEFDSKFIASECWNGLRDVLHIGRRDWRINELANIFKIIKQL